MEINKLICLIISCFFFITSHAQKQADSIQIELIVKQFEQLSGSPKKMAEYISEFEHQYLERYGTRLYPYIKKEYDALEQNKLPLELQFEVIFLMKNTYYLLGEHEKAANLAYDMLDIATQVKDSLLLYYSYVSIADIEVEMGNQESSLDFLLLAQKYAATEKSALAQTYIDLGSLYLRQSKLDLAKKNTLKGLKLAKETDDYFQINYGYSILMNYYTAVKEYDEALIYFQKIDSINKNDHFLETSRLVANASIRAAEIYKIKNDYEKSGEYFEKAFKLAKESKDRHNLVVIYNDWSELEELKGNYSQSLAYYKQHAQLQDSLYNEASISQINTLKTLHDLENKNLEIKAAKQKQKDAQKQLWLIIITGVVFILALIILALLLKSKLKAAKLKESLIVKKNKVAKLEVENLEKEVELKNKELANLFLHQYEKASLLNDVIETVEHSSERLKKTLNEHQDRKKDWINFKAHFDQVHEGFFDKLNALSPELTPKDIRFCAYIRMNLSSKEIAIMLGISHRTVQGIRSRVRKKINLNPNDDIVKFLMKL